MKNLKNNYINYFDFVRFCIDDTTSVPDSICKLDWNELYVFMCEQALVGVMMHGLQKLHREIGVPREVVLQAFTMAERIRERNSFLYKKAMEVIIGFQQEGFDCCILKGQGNALMYPDVYMRTPGDIDILVKEADRNLLKKYVWTKGNVSGCHYHHIEYQEDGVQIEVHFFPCSMNNPFFHHRLQKWFSQQLSIGCDTVALPDGTGNIPVPTMRFNIVYQLAHLMHHFFDEGIGLRQMMDYYYLVRSEKLGVGSDGPSAQRSQSGVKRDATLTSRDELTNTLKHLNLYQFAGAVMWVQHEVFGLEEEYYIVPPDEWRGKLLLEEIIKGGNFGQYSGLTNHSIGTKYFLKIKRNMRFIHAYPAEALCEPWFRTWHFFWRLAHR